MTLIMSDDESIVEEEYLIYADLRDNVDPNIFKHADSSFMSFSLDSDQPLLVIGGQAFVGTYKDTVGTAVFLEEVPTDLEKIDVGSEPPDPLFVKSPTNILQYVAHTRKTLEMSRVLLIEKKKQEEFNQEEEKDKVKDVSATIDVSNQDDSMCMESNVKESNCTQSDSIADVRLDTLSLDSSKAKDKMFVSEDPMKAGERIVVEDIENINNTSSY